MVAYDNEQIHKYFGKRSQMS